MPFSSCTPRPCLMDSTSMRKRCSLCFSSLSACLRSVTSRKLQTLPIISSSFLCGREYLSRIFPSLNSRMSKLSTSGWLYSSFTFARKASGSFNWSKTNVNAWSSSLEATIESGIRHMSTNFWLKRTILPCLSTTSMPSAVDSSVEVSRDNDLCSSSSALLRAVTSRAHQSTQSVFWKLNLVARPANHLAIPPVLSLYSYSWSSPVARTRSITACICCASSDGRTSCIDLLSISSAGAYSRSEFAVKIAL